MKEEADRKESHQKQDEEEKKKLLKDIEQLKQLINQLKSTIKLRELGYTCYPVEHTELNIEKENITDVIPDVELEIEQELYILSGMHCANFTNEYTFTFSAGRKITKKNLYAVQILNDNGIGKLGKWVLPMSVDVDEILKEYPIDDLCNVTDFVRSCKQQVVCYNDREEQYHQLKEVLLNVANARLETNFGYTRITIEFMGLKENDSNEIFDIILYLFYKSHRTRPCKLIPDSLGEDQLPGVKIKALKKYFNDFKSLDVTSAFEKAIKENSTFAWEKKMRCDDIIDMGNPLMVRKCDDPFTTIMENLRRGPCGDTDLSKQFKEREGNVTQENIELSDVEGTLTNTQKYDASNCGKNNSLIDENEENYDVRNRDEEIKQKTRLTETALEATTRNAKLKKTSAMKSGKRKKTKKKSEVE